MWLKLVIAIYLHAIKYVVTMACPSFVVYGVVFKRHILRVNVSTRCMFYCSCHQLSTNECDIYTCVWDVLCTELLLIVLSRRCAI